MQLAAEAAEAEERTQAAAGAQGANPQGPSGDPSQPSGHPQDTPGQQPVAPQQAGQAPMGPQPTGPQAGAAPVQKSVKPSGSRSTLRFADSPTIAMATSDDGHSGSGTLSCFCLLPINSVSVLAVMCCAQMKQHPPMFSGHTVQEVAQETLQLTKPIIDWVFTICCYGAAAT